MEARMINEETLTLTMTKSEAFKIQFAAEDNTDVYREIAENEEIGFLDDVSVVLRDLSDVLIPIVTKTSDGLTADQVADIMSDSLSMIVEKRPIGGYLVDGEEFSVEDMLTEYEVHKEELKEDVAKYLAK